MICCVVSGSVAVVSAAPGVIVVPRAAVYEAPSEDARVVSELGRDATICLVDPARDAGAAQVGPAWLVLRLPDHGGIGYVLREAVDLAAVAPEAWQLCGEPAPAGTPPALPLPPPPAWHLRPPTRPASLSLRPPPIRPVPLEATSVGTFMPQHPVRIALAINTGAAWIQPPAAAQDQIDDQAILVNASLGLTIYDVFSISGSAGAAFPGDHASFTQEVMPEMGGDTSMASSHVEVQIYSLALGLRTPFLALGPNGFSGAVFADYGWSTFHAVRSITDCRDCRTDGLTMTDGSFWRAGIDLVLPLGNPRMRYALTTAYQHYNQAAGLLQEFHIGMAFWFL